MNLAATRALVQRHEGLRLFPYLDTKGKVTIGFGRNLTDRGITRAQADDWLEKDLAECQSQLHELFHWFDRLDDVRQAVLVDIVFNVGWAGFLKFVRLIAAMTISDFPKASAEILDSGIALKRRTELALMMRTGQWS
jgi:lysozyme